MDIPPNKPKYDWPIDATLDMIGGKWKPLIVYALNDETLRFSQLLDRLRQGSPRGCLQNSFANLRKMVLSPERFTRRSHPKLNIRSLNWESPLCRFSTSYVSGDLNIWGTSLSINVNNNGTPSSNYS
jgi:hypothetical protein